MIGSTLQLWLLQCHWHWNIHSYSVDNGASIATLLTAVWHDYQCKPHKFCSLYFLKMTKSSVNTTTMIVLVSLQHDCWFITMHLKWYIGDILYGNVANILPIASSLNRQLAPSIDTVARYAQGIIASVDKHNGTVGTSQTLPLRLAATRTPKGDARNAAMAVHLRLPNGITPSAATHQYWLEPQLTVNTATQWTFSIRQRPPYNDSTQYKETDARDAHHKPGPKASS